MAKKRRRSAAGAPWAFKRGQEGPAQTSAPMLVRGHRWRRALSHAGLDLTTLAVGRFDAKRLTLGWSNCSPRLD